MKKPSSSHNFKAIFTLSLTCLVLASCNATDNSTDINRNTASPPLVVTRNCELETGNQLVQAYCLFESASILQVNGFTEQAKQEYVRVIALDAGRTEAYLRLGSIYLAENSLDMAEEMYLAAKQLGSTDPVPFLNLGFIYDSSGRPELAVPNYLEAIRLNPENATAHYNLALAYSRNPDRLDEATTELHKAIELHPGMADAHFALAQIYQFSYQSELAREHYEKALVLGHARAAERLRQLRR